MAHHIDDFSSKLVCFWTYDRGMDIFGSDLAANIIGKTRLILLVCVYL